MNEILEADRPWSWHSASRSAARHAFNGDERDAVDVLSSAVQMTTFDALADALLSVAVDSLTVLRIMKILWTVLSFAVLSRQFLSASNQRILLFDVCVFCCFFQQLTWIRSGSNQNS